MQIFIVIFLYPHQCDALGVNDYSSLRHSLFILKTEDRTRPLTCHENELKAKN